jgi:outer membrane protein assembly factor BamA
VSNFLIACVITHFNQLSLSECSKIMRVILFLTSIQRFILKCLLILPLSAFLLLSCSPTRRLAEGQYLLNKSKIALKSKEINPTELLPYEKQKPNKTILGLKFHLFLYNLTAPSKKKGIPGWLKEIGEEPVIWDPSLTESTTDQFKQFLENKGYYNTIVMDSVYLKNRRANIIYRIELNEPYRIRNISYKFEDQNLSGLILKDTANCLIKKGGRFDKETISLERQRLEELLKDNGYYRFAKEYVFFDAREVQHTKLIDLLVIIKESIDGTLDPETKTRAHERYKIDETYINPNYAAPSLFSGADTITTDTVIIGKNRIIYTRKHNIKPETLLFPNKCNPGSIYNLDNIRKTNTNYASLGLFRVINIQFSEKAQNQKDSAGFRYLNCFMELTPRKIQSYQTEIVGTYSSGEIGARASLAYNNYNLFRGAENLQVKLIGAIESRRIESGNYSFIKPMKEYGIESSLSFPKFFVPFRAKEFTRNYNPKTLISASYKYQDRPNEYKRTIASTSLSYRWKGNSFNTHQFFPFDFNYVWLPDSVDESIRGDIYGTSIESSFTSHTILATRYTFEFTTQVIEKKEDFIKIKTNLESAGNLIYGLTTLTPTENDSALFMKVPFFRYLKGDIDLRVYDQIAPGNKIVYRLFAGLGYPIGSSVALPYEKMYTAGGPNDLRAWNSDELGPGSDSVKTSGYMNKTGDIMLEANLEYRFKLFWVIEGALFVDAGNIWTYNQLKEDGPSTSFKWNKFYDEIAVGTGIGTRFDFSFLMVRFDFGFKMRDPSIVEGSRWIDLNQMVNLDFNDRFKIQFGIGYPF